MEIKEKYTTVKNVCWKIIFSLNATTAQKFWVRTALHSIINCKHADISVDYNNRNNHLSFTYKVWMLFIDSNVPFASDWILLSYNDNKLKLVRSLNESFRIHEISFAFSNSNCSDVNPRNTFVGKFLILLPYKTLFWKRKKKIDSRMRKYVHIIQNTKCFSQKQKYFKIIYRIIVFHQYTYSVVKDLSPVNASCAIREMLLLDKSMRRNRLKLANALGVISVMKFCSNRLQNKIITKSM